MKNKNIIFAIVIFLLVFALVIIPNNSFAKKDEDEDADTDTDTGFSLQGIIDDGTAFIDKGREQETVDTQDVKDIVIPVAQILVGVGNAVIVVGIAVMGIKYMVSNPEDKAKLKTQLVGLCISAGVIFGAEFIWKTVYEFLNSMS